MTSGIWLDAERHRPDLDGVPFVAITGSCGKTTTKTLAAALLDAVLTGTTSPGSTNCGDGLAANVLRTSPTDDFCLQELGAWGPGTLDAGVGLVRPSVGVVVNVRSDHRSAFRELAATAAEKAKVVAYLPPSGTAILNADDDLVWEMRKVTPARTLTFGRSDRADLRATDVTAGWPRRLSFRLLGEDIDCRVETRLLGEHGLGSALAAIGIALTMGVPLQEALSTLARVEPPDRRMSAVCLPDGVTFVRDDFKATSDSLPEVLHFLQTADADRKLGVVGRISDHPGRSRSIYEDFARAAAEVVDELVFVGDRPHDLWGRSGGPWVAGGWSGRAVIQMFPDVRSASSYLATALRPGDLVLLKGSGPVDHLERILLDRVVDVGCWRSHCGQIVACDECDQLHGGDGGAGSDDPA